MNDFEKSIYDFIKKYTGTTCIELSRTFGEGDYWLTVGNNVIYAYGLSDELSEALHNMIERAEIVSLPCHFMMYIIDGGAMKLPLAKNIPKNGYKEPHWLPSAFYTYDYAIPLIKEKYKKTPKQMNLALKHLEEKRKQNITSKK
jgi:hypothetical protein